MYIFLLFLSIIFISCIIALVIKYNKKNKFNINYNIKNIVNVIIIILLLCITYITLNNTNTSSNNSNNSNSNNSNSNNNIIININNISDITKHIENIDDNNYSIIEIDNYLSSSECDELILYADKQEYFKSQVLSPKGSVDSKTRKSKQLWLTDNSHIYCNKISKIASQITQLPIENMEELQIVKYEKGGYFKAHYDPEVVYKSNINDRIYTIIIYLNDNFEGGETYFKELDIYVKPKKGKAVLFKSLNNDKKILRKSFHQGQEITSGVKYMCNKWIHINKFIH